MAIPSEKKYHEYVAAWLRDSFADIEHEPTLESGREPDFLAHTPFDTYAIEVENDWESVYTGVGQAMGYASEMGDDIIPVVVVPAEVVEEPEYSNLNKRFIIESI